MRMRFGVVTIQARCGDVLRMSTPRTLVRASSGRGGSCGVDEPSEVKNSSENRKTIYSLLVALATTVFPASLALSLDLATWCGCGTRLIRLARHSFLQLYSLFEERIEAKG